MANAIEKLNTIAITDIEKVNTLTDDNIEKLNTLEFTGVTDAHTLIDSQDAGGGTSVTFSSLGSYDVLLFDWINFDSTDGGTDTLSFQATTASYAYNVPITSTSFRGYHKEDDTSASVSYYTGGDQAEGTAYNWLGAYTGYSADSSTSGNFTIYGHSSDTYVKHFMSASSSEGANVNDAIFSHYIAGYMNTTEAITAIQFKALGGGTFTGTISLYGLATS